jgi:dTDP-4-amino-4,6-dideoxygalactose transaminase
MGKNIPFRDLRIRNRNSRNRLLQAVEVVFRHGRLINGPEVQQFEERIADLCGRKYAVGVSSGTDALSLGLKSLGIGPGDEVITTSLSWIATANAIALTGAIPVFADIKDDLNIDPESVKNLITHRTKAIMPVHFTGKMCRMQEIDSIARENKLHLIEDASQAYGAGYKSKPAGSFGTLSCFSLNPMKILAACGEAGVVLTNRKRLYDRLIMLRYNGTINRQTCITPSHNGRLDTVQAAILLKQLEGVEEIIRIRRLHASRYCRDLRGIVEMPQENDGERHVYYTYTIQAKRRNQLKAFLARRGIETQIQHPLPMPLQPAYRKTARGEFKNARRICKRILCIPAHESLSSANRAYIAACIKEFYQKHKHGGR